VQGAGALLRDQQELMSMLRLHAALPPAVFESRFGRAVAFLLQATSCLSLRAWPGARFVLLGR
jgi:hypothetical protein